MLSEHSPLQSKTGKNQNSDGLYQVLHLVDQLSYVLFGLIKIFNIEMDSPARNKSMKYFHCSLILNISFCQRRKKEGDEKKN